MCGICGIKHFDRQEVHASRSAIAEMTDTLFHRGPDADGYYVDEDIALGMRRLKIIDLKTGDQPIYNENQSMCIVFNGEIYNYKQLMRDLIVKGHKFRSATDTEVIVHLYEEYGERCLTRLRGMFAFAIWEKREKKLFIARDHFGIKPLYYTSTPHSFVFASELKSILHNSIININKQIDYTALSDYFSFLYVPAPRTIFKDIYKLLPGHYLKLSNNKIEIQKYWDIQFKEQDQKTERDYIENFLALLEESVRLHQVSDVPVGAFLSGGADSSLVVALMSQLSERPIETFSIGYEGRGSYFDERKYSKIVAQKFKSNHHEFILTPRIEELIDNIVTAFDEPFADASAIPNYLLSLETRKYVTVALSGLGGDELCSGYERYLGCLLADKYQKIPEFFRLKIIPHLAQRIPDSKNGNHFNERLKRFINAANHSFLPRYFSIVAKYDEAAKKRLFLPEIQKNIETPSYNVFVNHVQENDVDNSPLNQMSKIDIKTYLVDDLLTLSDRMSMAHSLEVRVPFVDTKIVEFFASVPVSLKMKGLTKKYLIKKAAERLLPKDIIYRKKKGFSVPLVLWFRNEIKPYVQKMLNQTEIKKLAYFDPAYISTILNVHLGGGSNYDERLWALICFFKWHKKYMKNS